MKRVITIILSLMASAFIRAQSPAADSMATSMTADSAAVPRAAQVPFVPQRLASEDVFSQLWTQANTTYANGSYRQSIKLYDSIIAMGQGGYELYYNLGNAYFKAGQIGPAILYYNKAHRLAPTDDDVDNNLKVANGYVKDKIDEVPEFFLIGWGRALRLALSGNTWALFSLGSLLLTLLAMLMYLLPGRVRRRKAGFWTGVACGLVFLATTGFSMASRSEMISPVDGIVMQQAVSVKSSPDSASKDLFIIHEGTKVRVVGMLDQWREVQLADGKKGWLVASSIEMI